MAYAWPGLLKAVCPGDVFTIKNFDPTRSAGYTQVTYLCVWTKEYESEDGDDCRWVGALELGKFRLDQLWHDADTAVEFPWTRDLKRHV